MQKCGTQCFQGLKTVREDTTNSLSNNWFLKMRKNNETYLYARITSGGGADAHVSFVKIGVTRSGL